MFRDSFLCFCDKTPTFYLIAVPRAVGALAIHFTNRFHCFIVLYQLEVYYIIYISIFYSIVLFVIFLRPSNVHKTRKLWVIIIFLHHNMYVIIKKLYF